MSSRKLPQVKKDLIDMTERPTFLEVSEKETRERSERLQMAQAVFEGLHSAYLRHHELGEEGKEVIKEEKDAVQTHLKADIEAERQIFSSLETWVEENDVVLEYWAEELGKGEIAGSGDLNGDRYYSEDDFYFATIDGLDGTANYLEDNKKWPYGSMVAIAKGKNPKYKEKEVGGIMLPEEGFILMGIKDFGVWVYKIDEQRSVKLPTFNQFERFNEELILADDYYEEAKEILGDLREMWPRTGSTAASIAAIAIGGMVRDEKYPNMNRGWQGLVEVTRKDNLEQPTIYIIVSELGGYMFDLDGESIGDRYIKIWGQDFHEPIITVKDLRIKKEILERLS